MPLWIRKSITTIFVPGGIVLGAAVLFASWSSLPFSPPGLHFFYYAVFVAALALSLRFRSPRIVLGSLVIMLAQFALQAKGSGSLHLGQGKMAFEVIALLVPLDFILLTLIPERTLTRDHLIGIAAVLFFQSTFVAVFARPDQPDWALLHLSIIQPYHLHLAQPALLVFLVALGFLLWRVLRFSKAIDHGMFWSLFAACLALESGSATKPRILYFAVAGLILASSIVESSYSLAYRDELTGLNSRRAFNDALARLKPPYAIAAVDIDHFKSINDTYGHDTGDQVLRMVASRLANVSGGGHAYRVGGEEFTILFPGRTAQDIFQHLELLRMNVESCSFRLRGSDDRRKTPRDTDRRVPANRKSKAPNRPASGALSVTVSIGIGESRPKVNVQQVIELADKALYAAKQGGRNRIEVAGTEKKGRRAKASTPKAD